MTWTRYLIILEPLLWFQEFKFNTIKFISGKLWPNLTFKWRKKKFWSVNFFCVSDRRLWSIVIRTIRGNLFSRIKATRLGKTRFNIRATGMISNRNFTTCYSFKYPYFLLDLCISYHFLENHSIKLPFRQNLRRANLEMNPLVTLVKALRLTLQPTEIISANLILLQVHHLNAF